MREPVAEADLAEHRGRARLRLRVAEAADGERRSSRKAAETIARKRRPASTRTVMKLSKSVRTGGKSLATDLESRGYDVVLSGAGS